MTSKNELGLVFYWNKKTYPFTVEAGGRKWEGDFIFNYVGSLD